MITTSRSRLSAISRMLPFGWKKDSLAKASPSLAIKDLSDRGSSTRFLGVGTGARWDTSGFLAGDNVLSARISESCRSNAFWLASFFAPMVWLIFILWLWLSDNSRWLDLTRSWSVVVTPIVSFNLVASFVAKTLRISLDSGLCSDRRLLWSSRICLMRKYLLDGSRRSSPIPICDKRCPNAFSMVLLNRLKSPLSIFLVGFFPLCCLFVSFCGNISRLLLNIPTFKITVSAVLALRLCQVLYRGVAFVSSQLLLLLLLLEE